MRIVFHGENAASFAEGFGKLAGDGAHVSVLPDVLATEADRQCYADAEFIVGVKFDASLPVPSGLKLFHVPGAGYDAVDLSLLPAAATVCNCFGHEQAIAEYVMSAILMRHVPIADADARLRNGDWKYWAGSLDRAHDEMAGKTIGLLGFGHIGKAIAARAKAFEMRVHVANRSAVAKSGLVDEVFTLDRLGAFWGTADYIVVSVPLALETKGIVGHEAFAAMRLNAVVINVGRGPTIDERSLYAALKSGRIAGAIIDTWYAYPGPGNPNPQPSSLPFNELSNVVMTPHMSGWTHGTIRRRQQTIASNIVQTAQGKLCENVIRQGR
jgi:phosphoglycerate dehydrogenase-like enzyme